MERANLKDRQPEVYRRLVTEYEVWSASMLPEKPGTNSDGLAPADWPINFGDANK